MIMLSANPALPATDFTQNQLDDLQKITDYLNGLKKFQSRIRQINADGYTLYGMLYVSRPGRMRLDYFPPEKIQLLASAKHFTLVDTTTELATHYPFFTTPASLLLDEKINLQNSKLKILDIERAGNRITLTIAPKHDDEDVDEVGKMQMIFADLPIRLLGWHVLDSDNNRVSVVLEKIKNNVTFNKRNFFIYVAPINLSNDG